MLEDEDTSLSPGMWSLIADMRSEWFALDHRIAVYDDEFAALAKSDAITRRLVSIPGLGALNPTALAAAICNAATFASGRDLAACLGLVPH